MIVLLLPQILPEVIWVGHVRHGGLLKGILRSLVLRIAFVLLLDHGSGSTQAIEGEQMMDNVVVEPFLVEEDVVFLGHV